MENLQSESVTSFRERYKETIGRTAAGPVLLLQNSKIAAVLVSPDEFNQLQRYKKLALLDEQSQLVKQGHYQTQEQIEQGLRERGLI